MLVALIVIVLSVFGIWLLYRCTPPVEEWDDWPGDIHEMVGEEAAEYDFNRELNDYIKRKELGL